jgi:hypothetical protein
MLISDITGTISEFAVSWAAGPRLPGGGRQNRGYLRNGGAHEWH